MPKSLNFFKRFVGIRSTWGIGEGCIDALIFIPNQTIKVFGIGLFEKYPNGGDFTLGYKYYIENLNGGEISKSETIRESVSGP